MVACTFYTDSEIESFKVVTDKDINELLQELRKKNPKYYIEEKEVRMERGWFRKSIYKKHYSIIYDYSGNGTEYQVVNLRNSNSGTSINLSSSKDAVINFLLGVLSGYDILEHKFEKAMEIVSGFIPADIIDKEIPKNLDATMYFTGFYDGDVKLKEDFNKVLRRKTSMPGEFSDVANEYFWELV